jgi:sec-independent protein translocase protein TatA
MIGGMSPIHWILVLAVVLLLFGGKNKISDLMGDVAKGIKSFKKGMNEDEAAAAAASKPVETVRTIDHSVAGTTSDKPVEIRKVG